MQGLPLGPGWEDITWLDQVVPRGRRTLSTRKGQTSDLKPQTLALRGGRHHPSPLRQLLGGWSEKEFYVPAQHDRRRLDLVAGWQAEADRLVKAGLRLARACVIPLPSLLADLHLLHCEGRLVCNVVSTLDALDTQTCQACAPSCEGYDTACSERCLLSYLLPNRALKFAC